MNKPRRHYDNSRQLDLFKSCGKTSRVKTLNDEVRELRALVNILQKDINSLRADVLTLKNSLHEN